MSTIITQNPYTFTVEDNMSIKAVFENNTGTITGAKWGLSANGYGARVYLNGTDKGSFGKYANGKSYNSVSSFTIKVGDKLVVDVQTFSSTIYLEDVNNNYSVLASFAAGATYTIPSSLMGKSIRILAGG